MKTETVLILVSSFALLALFVAYLVKEFKSMVPEGQRKAVAKNWLLAFVLYCIDRKLLMDFLRDANNRK